MTLSRPYFRTYRPIFSNEWERERLIKHPRYARNPSHFIRAFKLIQQDILTLLNYVEPCSANYATYSLRTQELLTRLCIEVEANCKAILLENGVPPRKARNMSAYQAIEQSHFLSRYSVILPSYWTGEGRIRKPFAPWGTTDKSIGWYAAYNKAKHDRVENFNLANFESVIDAWCGLLVLLTSQFSGEEFLGGMQLIGFSAFDEEGNQAIGEVLRVIYPDYAIEEQYKFRHEDLDIEAASFVNFPYAIDQQP